MGAQLKPAYHKPTIERIDLIGEETTQTTNCKGPRGGGKGTTYPNPCLIEGTKPKSCKASATS
jgi:hypothetical protein